MVSLQCYLVVKNQSQKLGLDTLGFMFAPTQPTWWSFSLLTLPRLRWLHFDARRFVSVGNWFLAVESQRKLSGQKGAIHQVVGRLWRQQLLVWLLKGVKSCSLPNVRAKRFPCLACKPSKSSLSCGDSAPVRKSKIRWRPPPKAKCHPSHFVVCTFAKVGKTLGSQRTKGLGVSRKLDFLWQHESYMTYRVPQTCYF